MEQGVGMNYSRRLVDSNILRDNRREQRFTKFGVGTPAAGSAGGRLPSSVNSERAGAVLVLLPQAECSADCVTLPAAWVGLITW